MVQRWTVESAYRVGHERRETRIVSGRYGEMEEIVKKKVSGLDQNCVFKLLFLFCIFLVVKRLKRHQAFVVLHFFFLFGKFYSLFC